MNDSNEIIDVEAEEIEDSDNLPALIPADASNSEHIELPNRQDTLLADNPERRCVATNSRGERCRKFAIYGATVCRTHGGAVKRVKEAARIRVENASNRLMGKLIEFAFDDTKPPDVQLKAIQNSLDRAGLKPPAEVVLAQGEAKPYEQIFDVIGGNPTDALGYDAAAGVEATPAPAYSEYCIGGKAEAGAADLPYPPAGQQAHPSSDSGSLGQADRHQFDRHAQPEQPHGARSQRGPDRQERHITGLAAIQMANQANREAGVFGEQRAIEGPHKRYRRP